MLYFAILGLLDQKLRAHAGLAEKEPRQVSWWQLGGTLLMPDPKPDILNPTHRLHSSSFLGLPYRILNMSPKKELLWSL